MMTSYRLTFAGNICFDRAIDKRLFVPDDMSKCHVMMPLPTRRCAPKRPDFSDGCPPPLLERLARLRGRRPPHELYAGCGRAERDADRDQPFDPPARAGDRRKAVRAAEPRARAHHGRP